jgi:tetratricopeptide (TPR) repeat protein
MSNSMSKNAIAAADRFWFMVALHNRLEQKSGLTSYHLTKIGNLHYNNKSYYDAINYWKRSAAFSNDAAPLFNLGLAYNHPDVAQSADAIDIWRLTLTRFPDYKPAQESLSNAVMAAIAQAEAARSFKGKHILPEEAPVADLLAVTFFFARLLTGVAAGTESFRALRFARNAASQTLRPSEGAPVSVLLLPERFLDLVERIRPSHPHVG